MHWFLWKRKVCVLYYTVLFRNNSPSHCFRNIREHVTFIASRKSLFCCPLWLFYFLPFPYSLLGISLEIYIAVFTMKRPFRYTLGLCSALSRIACYSNYQAVAATTLGESAKASCLAGCCKFYIDNSFNFLKAKWNFTLLFLFVWCFMVLLTDKDGFFLCY